MVDAMVTQIEEAMGLENRIGLEVLIETALGMAMLKLLQPPAHAWKPCILVWRTMRRVIVPAP